jgi:hypothetical protein
MANTKNQHAHPDAPKPIHPDKEHFCSPQQFSWEQTSNSLPTTTFAGTPPKEESKHDFPHNIYLPLSTPRHARRSRVSTTCFLHITHK